MLQTIHKNRLELNEDFSPVSGRLFIVDRTIDMPACCVRADTYGGLLLELYPNHDKAREAAVEGIESVEDKLTLI